MDWGSSSRRYVGSTEGSGETRGSGSWSRRDLRRRTDSSTPTRRWGSWWHVRRGYLDSRLPWNLFTCGEGVCLRRRSQSGPPRTVLPPVSSGVLPGGRISLPRLLVSPPLSSNRRTGAETRVRTVLGRMSVSAGSRALVSVCVLLRLVRRYSDCTLLIVIIGLPRPYFMFSVLL